MHRQARGKGACTPAHSWIHRVQARSLYAANVRRAGRRMAQLLCLSRLRPRRFECRDGYRHFGRYPQNGRHPQFGKGSPPKRPRGHPQFGKGSPPKWGHKPERTRSEPERTRVFYAHFRNFVGYRRRRICASADALSRRLRPVSFRGSDARDTRQ